MHKLAISLAAALLVTTALTTAVSAKTRAIPTDASQPQTELVVPANSVAHLVFLSSAGSGQTYTGGGTRTDTIALSSAPSTALFTSSSAPGSAVTLSETPLDLVLTTQDDQGNAIVLPLDSFFTDNSKGSANPILDTVGSNAGFPEESGQIYIDQVQSTNNFGVPNPANLATLLGAPGVFDVQYLGWQDNNPPTSAFSDPNFDPWTYNNMVLAVYFTPAGTVGAAPEPAAWTMLLLGFFGLGAMLRRMRQPAHAV